LDDWERFCKGELGITKLPADIPKSPQYVYAKTGWAGSRDWLGIATLDNFQKAKLYVSYNEAKKWVSKLELKSSSQWIKYIKGKLPHKPKKPEWIPNRPKDSYKNTGWVSWDDWLTTNSISRKSIKPRSFEEARAFVRSLKLSNTQEWNLYCRGKLPKHEKLPLDIPKAPQFVYKNKGWAGYRDWLGITTLDNFQKSKNFLPYNEAKAWVIKLKLSSSTEWEKYVHGQLTSKPAKPENIPNIPNKVYKNKGWINWYDWLGTNKP